MKRKTVERDFEAAVEKAIKFAKSPDAGYLPGCAVRPRTLDPCLHSCADPRSQRAAALL
jgi:hypothetical protein